MLRRGILVDVTKCIGCGSCTEACQEANHQPAHEATHFDHNTFTYLMDRGNDVYVRRLCMHCEDPSCASVCPVGALRKTAAGPVVYDPTRCMGCRYCMMACPFGVPTYEWDSATPRVRKCEMCAGRGELGPACAAACPTGATITGERQELVEEAQRRLAASPELYYQKIYGLLQVGGTSVLVIGPARPRELGLPSRLLESAMPQLTWRALRHVPDVGIFGGVLMGGFWWLTSRKGEVAQAEGRRGGRHDA